MVGGTAARPARGRDAVGGAGEVEQVGPLGLVELQGPGQGVEHAGGRAGDLAALEPGVVLDAQPGECGDLAAPQSGHPAGAGGRQADLVRGDAGAAGGEELAHLLDGCPRPSSLGRPGRGRGREGCPVSTPIDSDFQPRRRARVHSMSWRRAGVTTDVRRSYEEEHAAMRQVVMYGPGDVRVEDREDPKIIEPTDAIIRLSATCICGSDLWPYRGAEPVDHQVMGHEYVGVVEEIGSEVRTVKVGDFVVGSFWASDNTCEICQAGYQAYCVHRVLMGTIGTQSELARIPLADGTLVATPGHARTRTSSRR